MPEKPEKDRELRRDLVIRKLREDVLSGRYGPEGGLPEEREIVEATGYARGTVKYALVYLEGEGLIVQRGRTYYVNNLPITKVRLTDKKDERS